LAELVMGLLQVAAGLGVPFHESISLLLNTATDNRRRVASELALVMVTFAFTAASHRDSARAIGKLPQAVASRSPVAAATNPPAHGRKCRARRRSHLMGA
jgi:hypothetical protein